MWLVWLKQSSRWWTALLAVTLVVHTALPVVLAAARLAERLELQTLGLLDAVDCHAGASGNSQPRKHDPGHAPAKDSKCDCCLSGCGIAGPAALPSDRGAIHRPLFAANAVTRVALDAGHLRSYLSERTRFPRSPPALA